MKKIKNKIQQINKTETFEEAYHLLNTTLYSERKIGLFKAVAQKTKNFEDIQTLIHDMKIKQVTIDDDIFQLFLKPLKDDKEILNLLELVNYQQLSFKVSTCKKVLDELNNPINIKQIFNDFNKKHPFNHELYQSVIFKVIDFNEAIVYLNEMKKLGLNLDDGLYSTVFNKINEFQDGIEFMYSLIEQKVKIRANIYSILIELATNEIQLSELKGSLSTYPLSSDLKTELWAKYNKKYNEIKTIETTVSNHETTLTTEPTLKLSKDFNLSSVSFEELKKRYPFLYEDNGLDNNLYIINSKEPLHDHINFLAKEIDVKDFKVTTGFLYKSGLELLSYSLQKTLTNQGKIELLTGSLQKYNRILNTDSKIQSMDKATAQYLNEFMNERNIELRTIESRFFHGKFYILEGSKKNCVIVGSSNVSDSGFIENQEFNLLYILNSDSTLFKQFKENFCSIWNSAVKIENLNLEFFTEMSFENFDYSMDSTSNQIKPSDLTEIKTEDFQKTINTLTDEEVQYRLSLWEEKKPNHIYENLEIEALKGYVLFEYKEYNLLVLESFEAANAFYAFKDIERNTLLEQIRNLSKTEIFEIKCLEKRGYHVTDRASLKSSIDDLFVRPISWNQI